MINLNTKDVHILNDGLGCQFCLWEENSNAPMNYEERELITLDYEKHELIKQVDTKQLPTFVEMNSESQWDFLCALYCAYGLDDSRKSFNYTKTDVAKLNRKITGENMSFTNESINEAWEEI